MSTDSETPAPGGQFLDYQTEDGKLKIDVRFEGETDWLTQQHMAELFQTTQQNISLHLQNIYAEGELQLEATHKESLSVRQEGTRSVRRKVDFYNLDAILSVGYRVKSAVATRFRIWATRLLREYIVKGFVLDDERLKNPDQPFDYFDELMRRIQDIRTSERRFYQKITDIYATSIDYDPTQEVSLLFFKTVQNKIVIVRDMWLTGFDAPCLHTMYVDKPMQGHGLMQAIARVNRVLTPSLPPLGRASPGAFAPSVSHAPTCSAQKQAGRADRGLPRAGGSAQEGARDLHQPASQELQVRSVSSFQSRDLAKECRRRATARS